MEQSTIWWVLAGLTVAAELMLGSFYLLMLSLGMAAAAFSVYLGATLPWQLVIAAGVGGGAVLIWRRWKLGQGAEAQAEANPNVNLDIGELVHINAWNADGSAQVIYRGANWTAVHSAAANPEPGEHRIINILGSRLVLEKV